MFLTHINRLNKSKLRSSNISIHFYNRDLDMDMFLFKINLLEDTCLMIVNSVKQTGDVEIYSPMISQLDIYYGNSIIYDNSKYLGMDYKDVIKNIKN